MHYNVAMIHYIHHTAIYINQNRSYSGGGT